MRDVGGRQGPPHTVVLLVERAALLWTRRLALAGGWLLLAVAFATVADALLRYSLGRPLPGTFEATELLLAAIIFFGLPYASLTDGHVSVDMLTGRLSRRLQYVVVAVNGLVCAVLLGFITVELGHLGREFLATNRTTITARIPVFPFLVPVTVAAALAALGFLVQAVGAAVRAARPDLPPPPRPHV